MDKRVLKSELKLKEAFIRLMQTADPAEITVKDLCNEAGLNRSTFYERFGYIDHLIEFIIQDCLDDVCAVNDDSIVSGNYDTDIRRKDIRMFVDRFLANKVLMKFCKSNAREKYFSTIIKAQVHISRRSMPDSIGYYPAYFQNTGVLGLIIEWINNGKDASEDHIIEVIHEFSKVMYHKF